MRSLKSWGRRLMPLRYTIAAPMEPPPAAMNALQTCRAGVGGHGGVRCGEGAGRTQPHLQPHLNKASHRRPYPAHDASHHPNSLEHTSDCWKI